MYSDPTLEYLRRRLAGWYRQNRRELPWRETVDPYRIWISEIILQQTRVVQGYDYYIRFMERFPSVADLAAAPEDEVLRLWQGLGYYSRARNLHAAARQVMERYGGQFPRTYDGVRALKGIGDYTAAAISSFAYGLPHAVVDGNVYRVLSRLFNDTVPIDTVEGKKHYARLADALLDRDDPAIHNQAMMELGALQCLPAAPLCLDCPLRELCGAAAQGTTGLLPVKEKKTKIKVRYFHYLRFLLDDGTTRMQRREGRDIWQHLYEYPLIESDHDLSAGEVLEHPLFTRLTEGMDRVRVMAVTPLCKHVLSHQYIMGRMTLVRLSGSSAALDGYVRVAPDRLDCYAVPRLIERLMDAL